jgi:hypothetical protein
MFDIKLELARRHHQELIAEARRERLGREVHAADRRSGGGESGETAMLAVFPYQADVAPWRVRLGGRLIRWGVALAGEGSCVSALPCGECGFPL